MYQRDVNEIKAFVKWRGPDALGKHWLVCTAYDTSWLYPQYVAAWSK